MSSGFLNVLLYRYTRPYLLPHRIDSLEDPPEPMVLHQQIANTGNHLTGPVAVNNSNHDASRQGSTGKSTDSAYEVPEIERHQDGTVPIIASPGRDHQVSGGGLTRGGAGNIWEEI